MTTEECDRELLKLVNETPRGQLTVTVWSKSGFMLDGRPVSEVVQTLQSVLLSLPPDVQPSARFHAVAECECEGEVSLSFFVRATRQQTEAEHIQVCRKTLDDRIRDAEQRRRLYEQLKKEFGDA